MCAMNATESLRDRRQKAWHVPLQVAKRIVRDRDVRWSKFAGTGKERNSFPFKKDLSLSRFFVFSLS